MNNKFQRNNRPYNKARKEYAFQAGGVAEKRFSRAALKKDLIIKKSTRKEDRRDHVDFWIEYDGKEFGVDVKGNNLPDEMWCEFKNVIGNPGWMYGKAHYIAFDMPEEGGFVVVRRMDLVSFCEENVSDVFVKNKTEAHLKKYMRDGNEDVITIIKLNDIRGLESYRLWEYFNEY